MFLIILLVVAVVLFLENCFRSIPKKNRNLPYWIVWLLLMPLIARFVQMPLLGFGLEVVYNVIVFVGLLSSFRSYFNENAKGSSVLFAVVTTAAVCLWPLGLLGGSVAANLWLQSNPGIAPPEWIKFLQAPGAVFSVYVMIYSSNLIAMSKLKSAVEKIERQKNEKPKARPAAAVK